MTERDGPARAALSLGVVAKHWAIYLIGVVAQRVAGFLLLPIYTRFLTPTDYGIKAMVMVGIDVVGLFLWLGTRTAMIRFYWGADGDKPNQEAVSTALFLTAGLFAAGVGISLWFSTPLAALFLGDAVHASFLQLGLVSLFFLSVLQIPLVHLQIRKRSAMFTLVSLGSLLTAVALNVLFVVVLRLGVRGILYSEIITHALFGLVLAGALLKEVGWSFSVRIAREMFRYGAPLTLGSLGWLVLSRADRLFLTHQGSLSEVGMYSLAAQFADLLLVLVIQPFANIWDPGQFELERQANAQKLFSRIFHFFFSILLIGAFCVAVFTENVLMFMAAPAFWPAVRPVPLLVLANMLIGMALFLNSALLVGDRTSHLGGIVLLTAAVNVAFNVLLTSHYLSVGAALSKVAALLLMVILTYRASQRINPRDYQVAATMKPVGCAAALFLLGRYVPPEPLMVSLLLKTGLAASLVLLVVWLGGWQKDDRERIWSMGQRVLFGRKPGAADRL